MKAPVQRAAPPLDSEARAAAEDRQRRLLKPPGSLGRLERLVIDLAAMTGGRLEDLERPAFIVFAADHGIVDEGVSAYPSAVTAQMVRSFLAGGAAVSVLSATAEFPLTVVDVGVRGDLDEALGDVSRDRLVRARVRDGARNFARRPALEAAEVRDACTVGRDCVNAAISAGAGLIGLGEMGIGNTTSATAVLAAVTDGDVASMTGWGTGISDEARTRKIEVVRRALRLHRPDREDPLDVLAKVGGLEICALSGAIVAAASARRPVLLDGFIATAAAVIAEVMLPGCRDYLVAAHRSAEPGHDIGLRHLRLDPLLALDMRLGEGSGAAVALPIVQAALRLHLRMATFAEAGVAEAAP